MNLLKWLSGLGFVEETTLGLGSVASAVGGGIFGDIVAGALAGGIVSGITGGDFLTGALTGGIGGGILGGFGYGFGSGAEAGLGGVGTTFTSQVTPSILTGAATTGLGAAESIMPNLMNTIGSGIGSVTAAGGGGWTGSLFDSIKLGVQNLGASSGSLSNMANLARLAGGVSNVYQALNAQNPQDPNAARLSASPWSQFAPAAAQELANINFNPNLVYGSAGYNAQQQQGRQNVSRSAAAAGANLSGGTLAALQNQGQLTASEFFNNRVNQLSQMAGATPQNLVSGQQAFNVAQYNQSLAAANQANMFSSGLAQLGSFFFA